MLTHERLLEVLNYDAETGIFTWRVKPRPVKKGALPGDMDGRGYWRISIDSKRYSGHRLAWVYVTGRWPTNEIDHINGDPLDNRIANLREATRSQNGANTRPHKDNRSGLKGATWHGHPTNKWGAKIQKHGKCISLGYYHSAEEAHQAYVAAAREIHGEFARVA